MGADERYGFTVGFAGTLDQSRAGGRMDGIDAGGIFSDPSHGWKTSNGSGCRANGRCEYPGLSRSKLYGGE